MPVNVRLNDEQGRLAALRRYEVLDSEPESEFGDIVSLLRSIFNVSFAAVNLIDTDRQWTMAQAGAERSQCRRRDSFCDTTIQGTEVMSVEDATTDPRFMANPFVTGDAHIRSYLGVPLTSSDGYNIGALCVFDTVPRGFTTADEQVLKNFAKVVMSQLELRLISRVDALTGGLTRRAFLEQMDRVMQSGDPVALILLDIDHFKDVNDTFGHPVGDLALRSMAQTVSRNLRRSDSFGRIGGEEFGVLLPGANAEGAMAFAERMRHDVAGNKLAELGDKALTLSMGIAPYRRGEGRDSWMERADQALYAAKKGGRNRCVLANDRTKLLD